MRALLAGFVLGVAVALSFSAQGLAADPADLEANLKITLVGVEKTLSLEEAKQALNVPSVSLALIDQDSIAFARAYGENAHPGHALSSRKLSKFVAAVGAMRLVDQKKLALDDDVNAKLTSWKVPANGFDKSHPVTLRGLISMTAGIGVPGFLGYAVGVPLPNLTQILYGVPPANSPPVTLIAEPGSAYHYSGGSYEVAEALMVDVAQAPFPGLMDALVLKPAGMSRSTFMQPLPRTPEWQAVTGHSADGKEILGGWHVFPEHAAAGLWSTPTDLANLLLLIGRAWRGNSSLFLLPETAREMLTPQNGGPYGLGAAIGSSNGSLILMKRGQNIGYQAYLILLPGEGQGMVVMTNSDNGSMLAEALIRRAPDVYGWPELGRLQD
ncbi:MAG TPA: serine hydrolase domain-containing protein [Methyloceanibacter sp.]|nr:serine hydrolase domain-containing protein [Methyloceanibacter sp.]